MRAVISPNGRAYSYAGMGYVNPDDVTQIANGLMSLFASATMSWLTHSIFQSLLDF